jgi:hypothetical protein
LCAADMAFGIALKPRYGYLRARSVDYMARSRRVGMVQTVVWVEPRL